MSSIKPTGRRILRPAEVAAKIAVSLPTMWRYGREDSSFPKPFKLSPTVTVFVESEIDEWLDARRAAALPARAQQPRSPKRATAQPEAADLVALVDACRKRGLKLDDLARVLEAMDQPDAPAKAPARPAKATTAAAPAGDADAPRKRRGRLAAVTSEVSS